MGFSLPPDANCNVPPLVEYLYVPTSGGGYVAYDVNNPPTNVGICDSSGRSRRIV
jgi:hypothetical protein